jgi:hypothetical protein
VTGWISLLINLQKNPISSSGWCLVYTTLKKSCYNLKILTESVVFAWSILVGRMNRFKATFLQRVLKYNFTVAHQTTSISLVKPQNKLLFLNVIPASIVLTKVRTLIWCQVLEITTLQDFLYYFILAAIEMTVTQMKK